MTQSDKMLATIEMLRKYGDHRIRRKLANKGFHYSDKLYEVAYDLAEYSESLYYLLESDQGWSKEYTRTHRNYRQACKIAYKLMKKEVK